MALESCGENLDLRDQDPGEKEGNHREAGALPALGICSVCWGWAGGWRGAGKARECARKGMAERKNWQHHFWQPHGASDRNRNVKQLRQM